MKAIFKITYPNGKICVGKDEAEQATDPATAGGFSGSREWDAV
jgi:hypothetical protein